VQAFSREFKIDSRNLTGCHKAPLLGVHFFSAGIEHSFEWVKIAVNRAIDFQTIAVRFENPNFIIRETFFCILEKLRYQTAGRRSREQRCCSLGQF